jgi:hypothetical protein
MSDGLLWHNLMRTWSRWLLGDSWRLKQACRRHPAGLVADLALLTGFPAGPCPLRQSPHLGCRRQQARPVTTSARRAPALPGPPLPFLAADTLLPEFPTETLPPDDDLSDMEQPIFQHSQLPLPPLHHVSTQDGRWDLPPRILRAGMEEYDRLLSGPGCGPLAGICTTYEWVGALDDDTLCASAAARCCLPRALLAQAARAAWQPGGGVPGTAASGPGGGGGAPRRHALPRWPLA